MRPTFLLILFLVQLPVAMFSGQQAGHKGQEALAASVLKNGTYFYKDEIKAMEMTESFKLVVKNATAQGADFHYFADQAMCNIEFKGRLRKLNGVYVYASPDKKNSFSVKIAGNNLVIKTIRCVQDECAFCPRDAVYSRE